MKKVLGVFLGLIALIIAGTAGLAALSGTDAATDRNPLASLADDAKNGAANAAIDALGVKDRVQEALDQNKGAIAAATGLSADQVDQAIDNLDVQGWTAATLPSDAVETGTYQGSYAGVDGTLTTYDNPGYVTVEAYGQTDTLAVPESAQQYLPLLGYL